MDRKTYGVATGAFAISVALLAAVATCWLAKLAPVDNSALASWAQAVGTVAAIGATIWLATREDRRRRQDAYDVAVLTAASLTFRLSGTLARVRHIAEHVEAAHKVDSAPENLLVFANYIQDIEVCSDDEQARLIPLRSRCAFSLAGTRDRLHAASEALATMGVAQERFDLDRRKSAYGVASQALSEATALLDRAVSTCQLASHAVTSPYPD